MTGDGGRVRRKAGVVLLSVLSALALSASTGAGLAVECIPSVQDLVSVLEYRHLLAAKAGAVWPGWERVPPLLQRAGRCEFLIGHPTPPKSFRKTAVAVGGWKVYAAPAGTLTPGQVAATWRVRAIWVATVPTRDEFQRAVDQQLGPGAVRLTDTSAAAV
jgi:hypothetical protein